MRPSLRFHIEGDCALISAASAADAPPRPKFWLGMTREDEDGWWIINGVEWDAHNQEWYYYVADKDGADDVIVESVMRSGWRTPR